MAIENVLLFLTYRCNLRCAFCLSFNSYWAPDPAVDLPAAASPTGSLGSVRQVREMTTAEIVGRVISQCVANGVKLVALSGGEVLVRRDAPEIFRALGRSGIRWCMDSNLMLCDDKAAAAIVESGCAAVFVSLDGPQPIHDSLRCSPKAYAKAAEGLARLAAARDRASAGERTEIIVNCVLQPGNEAVPAAMVDIAADHGADRLTFQLLSEHRRSKPFDSAGATEALREATGRARARNLEIAVYPLASPGAADLAAWFETRMPVFSSACTYVHTSLRIDPAGDVIPCLEYRMGNVLVEDLGAIWTGPAYRAFRRELAQQGPFSACLRCCNMTADAAPAPLAGPVAE